MWTITRWEIARTQQIGIGFYSEVFIGNWKGQVVAIKVVSPSTPADLFLHEARIWQDLAVRSLGHSSARVRDSDLVRSIQMSSLS